MDEKKRLLAAYDLLQEDSTTIQKLESIQTLIKGLSPGIDKILERVFEAHGKLSKIQEGEIIELSAESLPERNEQEKKRKKAILLFVKYWKQLQSEVERVKSEFEKEGSQTDHASNILASAKGPLGIITIAAVVIVAGALIFYSQKPSASDSPGGTQAPQETSSPIKSVEQKIKVIDFNGKKIPLTELTTGIGPECLTNREPAEHYHAKDHDSAKALGGSVISDPGGCGFGKVDEVKIQEVVL